MATIAAVNISTGTTAVKQITKTTLTGADDLLIKNGVRQLLVLENTGSGTPTIVIDGDQASTVKRRGLDPIDVSGGYSVALAASGSAGADVVIPLLEITAYTPDADNMPAVTGGTSDVTAYIIEQ